MKDIDTEFTEINEENKNKTYIIVGILYGVIFILSIILVMGLKNQKDVVEDNINRQPQVENKNEENNNKEDNLLEEENNINNNKKDETIKEDINSTQNSNDYKNEMGILGQI